MGSWTAPVGSRRRSSRWLAVLWVLGTIAAITVSVVAVRLAGAQVTVRHAAPLSTTEVADAVSEQRSDQTDDAARSDDSTVEPGDDHGSDDSSTSTVAGGSGVARRELVRRRWVARSGRRW